jgi:hypothetical protein
MPQFTHSLRNNAKTQRRSVIPNALANIPKDSGPVLAIPRSFHKLWLRQGMDLS